MQEVFEFLENNPVQYCATIGLDGKPKVRPSQMMYHEQGNLFYCTGAKKDVYAELTKNPYLEISVSTLDKWLRIRGKVHWVTNNETREKCLNASPLVKSIYKTADNPILQVFYIEDAEAVLADFSGNPPKRFNLNKCEEYGKTKSN